MKNPITIILTLFTALALFGQQRGVVPISKPWGNGTTRALIVGISNYQDEKITDLKFADKDAEAFADFLRSADGGSLRDSQLILLTDEKATGGAIIAGFDWLIEKSGEHDIAIIYFAGHGDVETNRYNPWGYLLPHDSPSRSYSLGAISIRNLQESIIPTLSAMKKARVIMISDACHAGQLAGSGIGGAQITAKKMLEQFDNEIKILSCQPNEVSNEGEQWGGGHGVFSYHLIEGLKGLANTDSDTIVRLLEIERYLEDVVSREVAPMRQVPLAVGDKYTPLIKVLKPKKAEAPANFESKVPGLSATFRRTGEVVLALQDSLVQNLFRDFEAALIAKNFFEPAGSSAEDLYQKLIFNSEIESLHGQITRNYAAALQEDAQQVLNGILQLNPVDLSFKNRSEKFIAYQPYPKQLERACELLGTEHYFYKTLKARQLFFEGILLFYGGTPSKSPDFWEPIVEKFKHSLEYNKEAAATYYYLEKCFLRDAGLLDSAAYYANQAEIYSPHWVLPKAHLAYFFCDKRYKRFDEAKILLDDALKIDSTTEYIWFYLAAYHLKTGNISKAKSDLDKALKINDKNPTVWLNLGMISFAEKDYESAKTAIWKSIEIDSAQISAYYSLGRINEAEKDFETAEKMFLKALKFDPSSKGIIKKIGMLYLKQKRYAEAEARFKQILQKDTFDEMTIYQLATLHSLQNNLDLALDYFEKALQNGYKFKDWILEDPALESIRKTEKFQNLLQEHFSDNR